MTQQSETHTGAFAGLVSVSPQMARLMDLVRRIARTDASVVVRGETGTGKELIARAIHELSPRSAAPFRAINCATLTPELLASELFGHVKGAFTGAVKDRRGLFRLADGGTLFLDEVAEIPLDLQARLLRVLQERSFVPLGGTDPVSVDVRLISATHRSLRAEVEAGRFREDLMYRIRVVPLFLPPLRDREGDVEALTRAFLRQFNAQGLRAVERVSDEAMAALLRHRWPGNVRELSNVIEYAFAVGEGPVLGIDDLTPELRGEAPIGPTDRDLTVPELERQRIVDALREAQGRKSEAAERLGISRSTLWRKLREHRLQG
jgi:two-component system response regulator AtoC